jgi:hypothetical protein
MVRSVERRSIVSDMDQGAIPPSLPFRLAAAYGAPEIGARPARLDLPGRSQPRVLTDRDTVELSTPRKAAEPAGARRLVAGAVSVPVDFDIPVTAAPAPSRGALAMYRHPADKNAAATAVNVGRSVDLTG